VTLSESDQNVNPPEPGMQKIEQDPMKVQEETLAQILSGDISSLTTQQRSMFLWRLAKGLDLNPLTKPFDLIVLNNKLTVYANRTAADQLARNHNISVEPVFEGPLVLGETVREDVYCVKMKLTMPSKAGGEPRIEYAVGLVGIAKMQGETLANQIMKCHTKAKRRGILAMCGLGFLDEIEVASVAEVAQASGRPGPRRVLPPPEASAVSDPPKGKNGPVTVVLPPQKGPA
jgi:hypothetical protein